MRLSALVLGLEGNVAPALQAAREQLQRSQLEVRCYDTAGKRRSFKVVIALQGQA